MISGHPLPIGGSSIFMEAVLATDQDLLREATTARSAEAFEQLVERYLGLVYAAAPRHAGD